MSSSSTPAAKKTDTLPEQEAFLRQHPSAREKSDVKTKNRCCLKCCVCSFTVIVVVVAVCAAVVFVDAAKPFRCGVASGAGFTLTECRKQATLKSGRCTYKQ